MSTQLSPNFTLEELTITSYKEFQKKQLEEVKPFIDNLYVLANYVLQPIRNYYKVPITVTSGFRGSALNEKVGGNKTSQHCLGEAVDFVVKGKTVDEVFEDIKTGKIDICYRQLIKEKINGKFWIHIGMVKLPFKPKDKYMQKLTTTDGKKYIEVK